MLLPPEIQGPVELLSVPLRVDHLPLVGDVLRRLRVAEIIDDLVPDHPLREISTGTCVEALVLSILLGTHTLYRVGETLSRYDNWLALGKDLDTDQLHDDRLGRALDMLFAVGLGKINTGVLLESIAAYDLDLRLVHGDSTTVSLHGVYGQSESDPENPDAAPKVTHGYSKDHRPDLKQFTFGLTVTNDGFVPLLGRATDGNQSDNLESAFTMRRLAEVMPNPEELTLVGDCKLFTSRNVTLAVKHKLNFITIIPRGLNAWERAYEAAAPRLDEAPVLRELVEIEEVFEGDEFRVNNEEVRETWRGVSVDTSHTWDAEDAEGPESVDLRAVVVHSTQLERAKRKSLERAAEKESQALARLGTKLAKREFCCKPDAEGMADELLKKKWRFHDVEILVKTDFRPGKRPRGRPRKGPPNPAKEKVFSIAVSWTRDHARFAELLRRLALCKGNWGQSLTTGATSSSLQRPCQGHYGGTSSSWPPIGVRFAGSTLAS